MNNGRFSSQSHPESFERLYDGITRCNLDPNHVVYAFSSLMMKLNIDNSKIDIQVTEIQDTFSDYLDELTFLLSRSN